jgi:hypothetical protein
MSDTAYPDHSTRVGRFTIRQLSVVQWVGVMVAPLAWTGQHIVGYGVGQARCEVGVAWTLGFEAAAVRVFLATREVNYGDGPPEEGRWAGVVPVSRLHFFATAAMVANVLFLAIVLMDGLASIFDALCVQS